MHKVERTKDEEVKSHKNPFVKTVTGYLSNWDDKNGYTHKIIVVSVFFVLITGFMVYRLTVSIYDKPLYTNEKKLKAQKRRMSEVSRRNDSLDRIEEIIELRKAERMKAYLDQEKNTDTLDIYGLLNEKR